MGISMNTPCEEWEKYRDPNGYGQVRYQGRLTTAHRAAYCELRGMSLDEIEGLVVMHMCDNPPCVNPEHLELGTHADNVADKVRKSRHPRGENCSYAKLSEAAVQSIKSEYVRGKPGFGYASLASKHGVALQTIVSIIKGKSWSHLEADEA